MMNSIFISPLSLIILEFYNFFFCLLSAVKMQCIYIMHMIDQMFLFYFLINVMMCLFQKRCWWIFMYFCDELYFFIVHISNFFIFVNLLFCPEYSLQMVNSKAVKFSEIVMFNFFLRNIIYTVLMLWFYYYLHVWSKIKERTPILRIVNALL